MIMYIAFFRGINVGGRNLVKMVHLKTLLEKLEFRRVRTYIQSGNVIFQAKTTHKKEIKQSIEYNFEKTFGFKTQVLVMNKDEFTGIIQNNPFVQEAGKDPAYFHVTFLFNETVKGNYGFIDKYLKENEEYRLGKLAIYYYYPNGLAKVKLTPALMESGLKTSTTTRNWRTLNKVAEMAMEK